MRPNQDMVNILEQNGCKVMYRYDNPFLYLWVNYEAAVKKDATKGMLVWGDSLQILDKVKTTVFQFYPRAELTAESGNKNVTFHLNG